MIEEREYQQVAVKDTIKMLKTEDRVQVHMAPGSGKTIISSLIRNKLKPETTIFFTPSIQLIYQTYLSWAKINKPFRALAVTSGRISSADREALSLLSEFDVTATTDESVIAAFLNQKGEKVIFSTYKSADRVASATKLEKKKTIDFAIFDEAHNIAGVNSKKYQVVLDNKKFRCKKRLSLSATPKATGRNPVGNMVGMDNEEVFGKVAHKLSFRKAVADGILCDFEVVVSYVTQDDINSIDVGQSFDEKLALAGTISAMKEHNLKRGFSFHSNISRATNFSTVLESLTDGVYVNSLNGSHSLTHRNEVLDFMINNPPSLVSNVKVLGEGVDFPKLDFIVMADPKNSISEIIQNIGRVMRKSTGKKCGYVVLPILASGKEIDTSSYKTIINVMKSLSMYDEMFGGVVAKANVSKFSDAAVQSFMKKHISVVGISSADKEQIQLITDSIKSQILDLTLITRTRNQQLDRLKDFVEKEGRMPLYTNEKSKRWREASVDEKQLSDFCNKRNTLSNADQKTFKKIKHSANGGNLSVTESFDKLKYLSGCPNNPDVFRGLVNKVVGKTKISSDDIIKLKKEIQYRDNISDVTAVGIAEQIGYNPSSVRAVLRNNGITGVLGARGYVKSDVKKIKKVVDAYYNVSIKI